MIIKNKEQYKTLKIGGQILSEVMFEVSKKVLPGVKVKELDEFAEKLILEKGGRPAFKNYGGKKNPFPATLCVSLNDEVVHGIPAENIILSEGDIVSFDVGMQYPAEGGLYTDMARTFAVGKISEEAKALLKTTEKGLKIYFKKIKAGKTWNSVVKHVQKFIEKQGFSIVRDYVGHGVGSAVHEDPQLPNFVMSDYNLILEEGMVLALEPMVCQASCEVFTDKNGWTVKTKDGKLSAHFEDTILVTKNGCEVITRLPAGRQVILNS